MHTARRVKYNNHLFLILMNIQCKKFNKSIFLTLK